MFVIWQKILVIKFQFRALKSHMDTYQGAGTEREKIIPQIKLA